MRGLGLAVVLAVMLSGLPAQGQGQAGPAGYRLDFSTYLGGDNWEHVRDVFVDREGNVYIAGGTTDNVLAKLCPRAAEKALVAGPERQVSSTGQGVDVKQGLIAHWEFEDGRGLAARDSSGNRHNGRIRNASPSRCWVRGCPAIAGSRRSLDFDGRGTYVEVPHAADLNTEHALTVACWVKLDLIKDIRKNHSFVTKTSPKQRGGWTFWMGQGRPAVAGYDEITFCASEGPDSGPDMFLTTLDADLVADTWYHVAVTWSANGPLKIYKNGTEMRSTTFQNFRPTLPKIQSTTGPLRMGMVERMPGYFHPLDGQLDDVRIYNRALSAAEIATLASGEAKPDPGRGDRRAP